MSELTAQAVFDKAFEPGRSPRSEAYKLGVLNCLRARIDGAQYPPCPYNLGTVEADAYFAGFDAGRELAPIRRDVGAVAPDYNIR
ncbi:hypothetical protein [Pusillimonas caeni]|uniref:hypothetical protein n=1 Tax=Pusillimonas caeni TaxID=1348472 RepID=UPI001ADDB6E4|nr:hypothetical protein [Pusillimonas caeni]